MTAPHLKAGHDQPGFSSVVLLTDQPHVLFLDLRLVAQTDQNCLRLVGYCFQSTLDGRQHFAIRMIAVIDFSY
jgi:hypothetical protein